MRLVSSVRMLTTSSLQHWKISTITKKDMKVWWNCEWLAQSQLLHLEKHWSLWLCSKVSLVGELNSENCPLTRKKVCMLSKTVRGWMRESRNIGFTLYWNPIWNTHLWVLLTLLKSTFQFPKQGILTEDEEMYKTHGVQDDWKEKISDFWKTFVKTTGSTASGNQPYRIQKAHTLSSSALSCSGILREARAVIPLYMLWLKAEQGVDREPVWFQL